MIDFTEVPAGSGRIEVRHDRRVVTADHATAA
jgi:hypothetical protein